MQCDNCRIDMRVVKVQDQSFYFKCVKCGKESIQTQKELEEEYENKNKKD